VFIEHVHGALMQLHFPTLILSALLVIQLEDTSCSLASASPLALNSGLMDSFSKRLPCGQLSDS
jgi:hypothetical protein